MSILINSNTFWLIIMNAALGILTLGCCVIVVWGVVQEIRKRVHMRKIKHAETNDHRLFITDLGITMADGGERIEKRKITVSEKGLVRESKAKLKRKSKK